MSQAVLQAAVCRESPVTDRAGSNACLMGLGYATGVMACTETWPVSAGAAPAFLLPPLLP